MIGSFVLFLILAMAAWLLFTATAALRNAPVRRLRHARRLSTQGRRASEAESLPRLVRQMASLLAAGRTGAELWGVLAQVLVAEPPNPRIGGRGFLAKKPVSKETGDAATVELLLAVQRASTLGFSSAAAIRSACAERAVGLRGRSHAPALTPGQHLLWVETAACFEVCEASGAPVAAVLTRLADTMEADFDAAALRETALAGPRATVRLLGWLPFIGVGLGMAMGVDPFAVLFGSPVGWAVLCAGIAFSVAGQLWSAALIRHAAHPQGSPVQSVTGVKERLSWISAKMRH
ncbi:tight adherence protein B [Arthrobacter sp. UYCu511]|uniref:type II secretion system F family protein n=1 Tax=Arthrobacter sp. UYCu511 TaxID=3156337 RepID=UPI00339B3397